MTFKAREYEEFRDKVFAIFENADSKIEEKRNAIKLLSEMYNSLSLQDHLAIRPMIIKKNR